MHFVHLSARILAGLELPEEGGRAVRQSRRLAQIKIKEQADPKQPEPKTQKPEKHKKKKEVSIKKLITNYMQFLVELNKILD